MARSQKTHRTTQKHVGHQNAKDIQKKNFFFVFSDFYFSFYFLLIISTIKFHKDERIFNKNFKSNILTF